MGVTQVDPSLFVAPAKSLAVSGGTAPFYVLQLRSPQHGQSDRHFIGKDLAHAEDEVEFYEKMLGIKDSAAWQISGFLFEYLGAVKLPCCDRDGKDLGEKNLLVMRNLRDGLEQIRLLDIKVGFLTADANWKGKSRFAAARNQMVDSLTNSSVEGFRLEGFDGMPQSLQSCDPQMGAWFKRSEKQDKKARRFQFQKLSAKKILAYFLDLRDTPEQHLATHCSRAEYQEAVLERVIQKLGSLCKTLSLVPCPQKWIGSSVALGFDTESMPPRNGLQAKVDQVIVNVFDWGRSELLLPDKFLTLETEDKIDRTEFWEQYRKGVQRITYEALRCYYHRFTATSWDAVCFELWDFDAMTADDKIGQATIPLADTITKEFPIMCPAGIKPLHAKGKDVKLSVAIEWRDYPTNPTFQGGWEVRVVGVNVIPNMDKPAWNLLSKDKSDGYCTVTALQGPDQASWPKSPRSPLERSKVIQDDNHPQWNEAFEFAVRNKGDSQTGVMNALLSSTGLANREVSADELRCMFPSETVSPEEEEVAFNMFLHCAGM